MNLPLLHRRRPTTNPNTGAAGCWMCLHERGVPLAESADVKTTCDRHTAAIRRNATAQSRPGYGTPGHVGRCTACGELHIVGEPHQCWEQLDDNRATRRADV